MQRTTLFICPCCRKVRKFGEWVELTYTEKMLLNPMTVEELSRTCDACVNEAEKKVQLASNE